MEPLDSLECDLYVSRDESLDSLERDLCLCLLDLSSKRYFEAWSSNRMVKCGRGWDQGAELDAGTHQMAGSKARCSLAVPYLPVW